MHVAIRPGVRLRNAISGLMPRGRLEEAIAEMSGVLESDPLSPSARWWFACMLWLGRHPDRAAQVARGMIEPDPTSFYGSWALGLALAGTGALDESIVAMQRACELSGNAPVSVGFLGQVYGHAGRRDDALAMLGRLQEAGARGCVPPFSIAQIHVGLGDWDAALEWMDRAIEARDPIIMPIKSLPFLDPVRDDPRFVALRRKMNLA